MVKSTKPQPSRVRGVVDTPAAMDSLGINPYVEGLSGFIADCQTPMTIAVQGDWGTGKTNMMLLTESKIAPTATTGCLILRKMHPNEKRAVTI